MTWLIPTASSWSLLSKQMINSFLFLVSKHQEIIITLLSGVFIGLSVSWVTECSRKKKRWAIWQEKKGQVISMRWGENKRDVCYNAWAFVELWCCHYSSEGNQIKKAHAYEWSSRNELNAVAMIDPGGRGTLSFDGNGAPPQKFLLKLDVKPKSKDNPKIPTGHGFIKVCFLDVFENATVVKFKINLLPLVDK